MNRAALFTTGRDEWATPDRIFDPLHREFGFSFDMAASVSNRLLERWYGPTHPDPRYRDGLALTPLDQERGWGFCNPPYSRGLQKQFIKASAERRQMVLLLPSRTDTITFHRYIYDSERYRFRRGVQVRFLKGRIKFGGAEDGAPFPSMLVIFR